jgi:hypothetical protein
MDTPEMVAAVRTVIVLRLVVTILPGDLHLVARAARRTPPVVRVDVDRVRHGASICMIKVNTTYKDTERPLRDWP